MNINSIVTRPLGYDWYCGLNWNGLSEEPLLKEFHFQGKTVGTLTKNKYDAVILNAQNMLIADIDLGDPQYHDGVFFEDPMIALRALETAIANPALWLGGSGRPETWYYDGGLGFRVYRTAGGLRHICTTHQFNAGGEVVDKLLRFVYCDPRYRSFCRKQNDFRARLTPKPWRTDEKRTCVFWKIVGSNKILPPFKKMVQFHDRITSAFIGNLSLLA